MDRLEYRNLHRGVEEVEGQGLFLKAFSREGGEITINFWILSEKCEFHVVVTSHYDQVYEFWFVILQMGIAKYNIGLLEVTSNPAFSRRI